MLPLMVKALKKVLLLTGINLLSGFWLANQIQANSVVNSFTLSLDSSYTILDVSQTQAQVEHTLKLRNDSAAVLAERFALKLDSTALDTVVVKLDGREISANTVETNNQTSIAFSLSDQLGVGKEHIIEISYLDPNLSYFQGSTGIIFIPALTQPELYDQYSVRVITPSEQGLPTQVYPEPTRTSQTGTQIVTEFGNLTGQPLTIQFGTAQSFDFDITYALVNESDTQQTFQIPIPPDTNRQKVWYQSIEPPPLSLSPDENGNWIATYSVGNQATLPVKITGQAHVFINSHQNNIYHFPVKGLNAATHFWPTQQKLITKLNTISPTSDELAEFYLQAFDWQTQPSALSRSRVADYLNQDTLSDPIPLGNQELVDVFVTFYRGIGQPTRRVLGLAIPIQKNTQPVLSEKFPLHVWAERYNTSSNTWEMADPVWIQTMGSLDYFHLQDVQRLAIAHQGTNDARPELFNFFTTPGASESAVVSLVPRNDFSAPEPALDVNLTQAKFLGLPVSGNYAVSVRDTSGQAHYQIPIKLTEVNGDSELVFHSQINELTTILPYQGQTLPINITNANWFQSKKVEVQLTIGNKSYVYQLQSGPRTSQILYRPFFLLAVGGISVCGSLITGSVLVYRRKRQNSVRRKSRSSK